MINPVSSMIIRCEDESQTALWADRLSDLLEPGDVIALNGNLGAGKTRFVRAISESLGIDESTISSPTYTIIQSYPGRLLLHHFDLYRIQNEDELYESGCDEFLNGAGVCLIEWADRFPGFLPEGYLEIAFEIITENARSLTITAWEARYQRLAEGLKCFLP